MGSVGLQCFCAESTGDVVVETVSGGGPAQRSGRIGVGDYIRSVDGQDVRGMSEEAVARMLDGRAGTRVVLAVQSQIAALKAFRRHSAAMPPIVEEDPAEHTHASTLSLVTLCPLLPHHCDAITRPLLFRALSRTLCSLPSPLSQPTHTLIAVAGTGAARGEEEGGELGSQQAPRGASPLRRHHGRCARGAACWAGGAGFERVG